MLGSYDPVWDYAPVTVVAAVPDVTVARPSAPSRTVPGLIVRAKAGPGKPDLASPGGGPAVTDMVGVRVPPAVMLDDPPSFLPPVARRRASAGPGGAPGGGSRHALRVAHPAVPGPPVPGQGRELLRAHVEH